MNIVLVSTAMSISGGARQALYLARSLQDAGYKVVFFSYPMSGIRSLDNDLEWRDLPRKICDVEAALRSCFIPGEYNIVHAFHNKAVKMVSFFGTLWRMRRLPVACVAHRGVTSRPKNPLPYLVPGIKAFIVNSHACAKQLPLLWRKKCVHVVWNSVPDNRVIPQRSKDVVFEGLGITPGKLVIGNICNDNPFKGAPALLKLYASIKNNLPPSCLLIIGTGMEQWESLCSQLGLSSEDVFFVRTQQVADYLQIMSLFVFSSQFVESQPNVLLEAMSAGLPILASNVGGVSEIIKDDYLINIQDERGTADRVIKFVNDDNAMVTAGIENKNFSEAFSTKHRLQAILKIYEDISTKV